MARGSPKGRWRRDNFIKSGYQSLATWCMTESQLTREQTQWSACLALELRGQYGKTARECRNCYACKPRRRE